MWQERTSWRRVTAEEDGEKEVEKGGGGRL